VKIFAVLACPGGGSVAWREHGLGGRVGAWKDARIRWTAGGWELVGEED
jgi:hypothetical protein